MKEDQEYNLETQLSCPNLPGLKIVLRQKLAGRFLGKRYHVFGTHTEAVDPKIRLGHLQMLKRFVDEQQIPAGEPVLMGGDMNINSLKPEYRTMLSTLNATHPPLQGQEPLSCDSTKNGLNLLQPVAPSSLLDYILFSNRHQQPSH